MPAPKKYPDELRERAVRLVFESGRPIAHVARDLGVHREPLRLGVRQAEATPAPAAIIWPERARAAEGARAREPRAEKGQRDPQGRLSVFRQGARPSPTDVSAFIDERRADFGVELICRTVGVSASAYHARRSGERSRRAIDTSDSPSASARSTPPTTTPTATGAPGRRCAAPARRWGEDAFSA